MSKVTVRRQDDAGRFTKSDPTYDLAYAILSSRKPNQGRFADLEVAAVAARVIGAPVPDYHYSPVRVLQGLGGSDGGAIFPQEFGPASDRPRFGAFYGIRKAGRLYTLGVI